MLQGNIRDNLPDASVEEIFQDLAVMSSGSVRIERICSEGQASPEDFWYNQNWDEWVMIMSGRAEMELADPAEEESLIPGDWLLIPAGRRHRIRSTAPGTLWLAVHGPTQ